MAIRVHLYPLSGATVYDEDSGVIAAAGAVFEMNSYYEGLLRKGLLVVDADDASGVPVSTSLPSVTVTNAASLGKVLKASSATQASWSTGAAVDGDIAADVDGAVFDSTTDTYTTLRAALNRLATRGGRFLMPTIAKYARITQQLISTGDGYSGSWLLGGRIQKTVSDTTSDPGAVKAFIQNPTVVTDITVDGTRFTGNGQTDHVKALQFGYCTDIRVQNATIEDVGREGIYSPGTRSCARMWITNCRAERVGKQFSLAAYNTNADNVIMSGLYAYDCGMAIEQCGRGLNLSNSFFEKLSSGMKINSTSAWNSLTNISCVSVVDSPNAFGVAHSASMIGRAIYSGLLAYRVKNCLDLAVKPGSGQPLYVNGFSFSDGYDATANCINLGAGGHVINGGLVHRATGTIEGSIANNSSNIVTAGGFGDGHSLELNSVVTIPGMAGTYRVTAVSSDRTTITINGTNTTGARIPASGTTTISYVQCEYPRVLNMSTNDNHVINNLVIVGLAWASCAIQAVGMGFALDRCRIDFRGQSPGAAVIFQITAAGSTYSMQYGAIDLRQPFSLGGNTKQELLATIPPQSVGLTWNEGDIIWNSTPGPLNSGLTVGTIANGSSTLAVNNATQLWVGAPITVVGLAGTRTITAISGTNCTLDTGNTTGSDITAAAVAYSNVNGWTHWSYTTSGTFGAYAAGATASTTASSATITMSASNHGLYPGCWITLSGVTGAKQVYTVSGATVVLTSTCSHTVNPSTVAFSQPVVTPSGAIT